MMFTAPASVRMPILNWPASTGTEADAGFCSMRTLSHGHRRLPPAGAHLPRRGDHRRADLHAPRRGLGARLSRGRHHHRPIGLAPLEEKNLLPTPGGQASFAVLLFQDLAVIPLLLALAFIGGEAEPFHWSDAAMALGFVVALIAGGRLVVRPLLRYIAGTRLR